MSPLPQRSDESTPTHDILSDAEQPTRLTVRIEPARSRFSPPTRRWASVLVAIAALLAGIILAASRRPLGRHRARPHVTVTRRAAPARSRPSKGQDHTRAARRRAIRPRRAGPALHRSIRHTPVVAVSHFAPSESVPATGAESPPVPSAPQSTPAPRRASPGPFSYLGR